jgi:4-diphosphocytidyl-2C-methyl-D-erythritol kinase
VISATAQAKINLYFKVGTVRQDGYHPVVSFYQALDLTDKVSVEKSDAWQVEVISSLPNLEGIPLDASNIVVKAALELAREVGIPNPQPMRFVIEKQVPVAGGMAGGSADAAAALVALNEAWCLGLALEDLANVGSRVGADVPFALMGGSCIGYDTGIELRRTAQVLNQQVVLLINDAPLSTKAVFERFDQLHLAEPLTGTPDFDELGDWIGFNSLASAAFDLLPSLRDLAQQDFGCGKAFLSGSGPTLWYLAEDIDAAKKCASNIEAAGYRAVVANPSSRGAGLS